LTNKRFLGYVTGTKVLNAITPNMRERVAVRPGERNGPTQEVQSYMKYRRGVLAVLSVVLLAGCAPKQPPKPDPVREEVTILQKQLLELQRLQTENRETIATLSAKVQSLEERLAKSAARVKEAPTKKQTTTAKKKPSKKPNKKVRRQE
jgi:hypothetical protein